MAKKLLTLELRFKEAEYKACECKVLISKVKEIPNKEFIEKANGLFINGNDIETVLIGLVEYYEQKIQEGKYWKELYIKELGE